MKTQGSPTKKLECRDLFLLIVFTVSAVFGAGFTIGHFI